MGAKMGTSNLFVNAMKTYQQLLPELRSRNRSKEAVVRSSIKTSRPVAVGSLLDAICPVPARSLLLGKCTDGLPFLMELGDPEMGAILIGCENGCGKTHQLQVMVDSAIRTNSPRKVQIAILTLNPDEWMGISNDPQQKKFLHGLYAWYDDRAERLIEELTELAETRRRGQPQGTDVLFILDDLNAVEDLSYEAQVNLRWLLEYGSQSGVWVVGSISASRAAGFGYWIETFRTRIIGRVPSTEQADLLASQPGALAADLELAEFRVWTGEGWLTYALPPLGDLETLED